MAMENGPFIDGLPIKYGLPIKMVIFHGYERSKASTTRIELHVASETLG